MWIAKVSQIIGSSSESFEEAAKTVLARANRTLRGITEIEVVEKTLKVDENAITEYRVRMRLSFDVAPKVDSHW